MLLTKDDLVPVDAESCVPEALRRLPASEQASRLFRIRRALNLSMKMDTLDDSEVDPKDVIIIKF